ncbi:hypothetical protein ACQCN2_13195 [Brevibacillus ginsengisoli]|uniref:hypothetical protein n=1 Tax=Brevibacillus ginsengisoli TaxID=363854 RepID=UPI003CEB5483
MIDTIGAMSGLIGGAFMGLLGLYIGNRQAKKNRGLDERFHLIRTKARANSWIVTLITTYILFLLLILKFDISIAAVLGMLLLTQMGSWAFFVFYYEYKH